MDEDAGMLLFTKGRPTVSRSPMRRASASWSRLLENRAMPADVMLYRRKLQIKKYYIFIANTCLWRSRVIALGMDDAVPARDQEHMAERWSPDSGPIVFSECPESSTQRFLSRKLYCPTRRITAAFVRPGASKVASASARKNDTIFKSSTTILSNSRFTGLTVSAVTESCDQPCQLKVTICHN